VPYKPTGAPPGRPRKSSNRKRAQQIDLASVKRFGPGRWTFGMKASRLAQQAGVKRQTGYRWRSDPNYQHQLLQLFVDKIIDDLRAEQQRPKAPVWLRKDWRERFSSQLEKYWRGPVRSHLNGKLYRSPKAYERHILESNSVSWCGDWSEEMKLAAKRPKPQEHTEGVTVEWEPWESPDDTK
jgi:hypothetical protein